MRLKLIALSLFIAGCTGDTATVNEEVEHGVSTAQDAAIGFVTTNAPPPASATDSRDDGVMRDGDGRPYGYAFLGSKLPDFAGPMVSGADFSSSDIDAWTIIDVWGIWCGDCRADGPYASAVAAELANRSDLNFLSIHTPPNARRADEAFGDYGSIDAYFDAQGYRYPTVIDADASLREKLEIAWTPTYLLVSPDGIVRGFRTDLSVAGDTPVADFLADIERVRAETPVTSYQFGFEELDMPSTQLPFTMAAIAAQYPDYQVRAVQRESGPLFTLGLETEADLELFRLEPSWDRGVVTAIVTSHIGPIGPFGSQIGQTRVAFDAVASEAICDNLENGDAICRQTLGSGSTFSWRFSPATSQDEAPQVLSEMRLDLVTAQ